MGAGIAALSLIALATRLRPDLFAIPQTQISQRLNHPLWSAVGLLVACGLVLCLQAASDAAARRPARVIAAALFPALAVTLFLTLSRDAIVAAAFALLVFAVLGRPEQPPARARGDRAPDLVRRLGRLRLDRARGAEPTTPEAIVQGKALQDQLPFWCVCAGALRAALIPFDRRLARLSGPRLGRSARLGAVVAGVLVLGAGTCGLEWFRLRPDGLLTTEAHSLRRDAERARDRRLVLLLVAIGALLAAPLTRWSRRPAAAAIFAIVVAWALHSAIDWSWERPAATVVAIVLAAVAASVAPKPSGGRRRLTPWVAGIGALSPRSSPRSGRSPGPRPERVGKKSELSAPAI